jgi:hypothetical protein
MTCPTCSHTAALLCIDGNRCLYHHCERCGTVIASRSAERKGVYVPQLVERCRKFQEFVTGTFERCGVPASSSAFLGLWTQLGIAESINLPGERT